MQVYTLIINKLIQAARRGFLPWITCNRSGVVFSCWSVSRITARSYSGAHVRTHAHAIPRRVYLCTLQSLTSRLYAFLGVFRCYPINIKLCYKKPLKRHINTLKQQTGAATPYRPRRFPGLFLVSKQPGRGRDCNIFVTFTTALPDFQPIFWGVCVIFQNFNKTGFLDRGDFLYKRKNF